MYVGNTPIILKLHLSFFFYLLVAFSVSPCCPKPSSTSTITSLLGFDLALLKEKQQSRKESPDRQGWFQA